MTLIKFKLIKLVTKHHFPITHSAWTIVLAQPHLKRFFFKIACFQQRRSRTLKVERSAVCYKLFTPNSGLHCVICKHKSLSRILLYVYRYKLQPATREPFLKPPKGKKLKTKPSPNTNSRSTKFHYPPPIIHDCQCANRMRSARVCCPNSAGNSLHFLSRPQAPISRLAPLADSLDLAKSHRPHLHSIYHHSAYPLVYFAPEMPQ